MKKIIIILLGTIVINSCALWELTDNHLIKSITTSSSETIFINNDSLYSVDNYGAMDVYNIQDSA